MNGPEKKMSFGGIIMVVGAMLAYLIGSGFSTGTETIQYFSGYGVGGAFVVLILGVAIQLVAYIGFTYAGKTRGMTKLQDVLVFYSKNKIIGYALTAIPIIFCFALFIVMLAGGGSTLKQQFGLNPYIGSGIIAALSIIVAIFGLKGIVDVIGAMGPVVCGFALIVAIISAFTLFPHLKEGAALIASGEVEIMRISGSAIWTGLSWGGICVVETAAFMVGIGNQYKDVRWKDIIKMLVITGVCLGGTSLMVGLCHIANIEASSQVDIPNLLLAKQIWEPLSYVYTVVIIMAIFSTCVPALWSTCNTFTKEGSKSFKIMVVVLGVASYIIATIVPYGVLLNWVFSISGWVGLLVFVAVAIGFVTTRAKDKKELAEKAE